MLVDLYPDWKNGIITQDEYMMLKQNISEKIETLDKMIGNILKTAKNYEEGVDAENEFISHFKKHGKIKSLTRKLLLELIDEILVHEGGNITIKFKFDDAYKEALEYIEINKGIIKTA
jgi:hypothetical protein